VLKINLLPKSIYEGRAVKRLLTLFGVLSVVVLLGMLAWILFLNTKEKQLTESVLALEAEAEKVASINQETEDTKAKTAPITAKLDYIADIVKYNNVLPKLYSDVAKYTYNRIEYTSMSAAGNQLTISAHARTLGDCGRYLMNMYRAGKLFTSVSISGVPGWPAGSSSGGVGMMGGMRGGMPGGVSPMGGMSPLGGMPPVTGGMPGMAPMTGGMPGMSPMAGGMMGGGSSSTASLETAGFDFTVTCGLRKAIQAPMPPTQGGSAAGAGGAMMMPGMPMMPGTAPGTPGAMTTTPAGGTADTEKSAKSSSKDTVSDDE
jgi:Tfp pilus assembly protein PilN